MVKKNESDVSNNLIRKVHLWVWTGSIDERVHIQRSKEKENPICRLLLCVFHPRKAPNSEDLKSG